MKTDKKTGQNQAQQRPEDANKQNAQQEREYREQKNGTTQKEPKQPTDEEAIETYQEIKSDQDKKKGN